MTAAHNTRRTAAEVKRVAYIKRFAEAFAHQHNLLKMQEEVVHDWGATGGPSAIPRGAMAPPGPPWSRHCLFAVLEI